MQAILLLVLAALLEVGGDALVRTGLHGGKAIAIAAGAVVLFLYGLCVNLPKWDFGRLLGVYIALFFVAAQVFAVAAFHEKLKAPTFVGGALIVAGGLVLTLWKAG